MKEEGDDRYKQINERISNREKNISDMDEKCENRNDESNRVHDDQNQGKAVETGFHSETSESEVEQLLKDTIIEIGMSIENARMPCKANYTCFIFFKNDDERNKYVRSAKMLGKELRRRKIKMTRSMDAEERFHQKRMGYVKYCIHMRHKIPLNSVSLHWNSKHVSVKGKIVVKTCQSGSLKSFKYQDIESEVGDQIEKWQSNEGKTTSSQIHTTTQGNQGSDRCTSEGGRQAKAQTS